HQRRPPIARRPRRQHDGRRLHRLDRAGQEDGDEEGRRAQRGSWPSSTRTTAPVTHSDDGATRYSSVLSSWAGWPRRWRGNAEVKSPIREIIPSIISDEKLPGAIEFTLIRYRDHSMDRTSVMRLMAALVIEYRAAPLPP